MTGLSTAIEKQELQLAPAGQESALSLAERWQDQELPKTWPDQAGNAWRVLWGLLRSPFERGEKKAQVPEAFAPLQIPEYATEQFHGLPNGYYSQNIANGYDKGFESSMLFRVRKARQRMAELMKGQRSLDVGCGSGRLAAELTQAGVGEVWGLDPSPYMLKIAQQRTPGAHFVQGLIEKTKFPDAYFDSVGACFLFHELPKEAAAQGLTELFRISKPGAVLCITEPCREHIYENNAFRLLRNYGLSGLYFHLLAKGVYEPFLEDWQDLDHKAWLAEHGFDLVERVVQVPFQYLVARRRETFALAE